MLQERFWPRLYRILSEYPHMMERISRLRTFATTVHQLRSQTGSRPAVGALPIRHLRLKALPVMMVHGHDHAALGVQGLPPFELSVRGTGRDVAGDVRHRRDARKVRTSRVASAGRHRDPEPRRHDNCGAQRQHARATGSPERSPRDRLVLGPARAQSYLLSAPERWKSHPIQWRGVPRYIRSPREHFESVRDFIGQLERAESGGATPLFVGQASAPRDDANASPSFSASIPEPRCPSCQQPLLVAGRFCEHCGAQLSTAHVM